MQGSAVQLKKHPRQSGAIVLEYIVLAAVLVLGLVVGVSAFRDMVKPILGEPGGGGQSAAVASAQPANPPGGAQQGALQSALAANAQPSNAQPGLPTAQDPRDLLLRPNNVPAAFVPENDDLPGKPDSNKNSAKPPKSKVHQIADATKEFLKEELGYNDGKKALADFKKGNVLGGLKHSAFALLGISNIVPAKAGVTGAIIAGKWAGKWAIKKAGKSKIWKWVKNKFKKPNAKGGLNLFKWGDEATTTAKGWREGDYFLHLPNKGSVKANWAQNSGRLREAMGRGKPIFDSFRNTITGAQKPTKGFLNAERKLLESRGWRYNPTTGAYHPPK